MAKLKQYLTNTHCCMVYSTPLVQDQESALKWVLKILKKRAFYLKNITIFTADGSYNETVSKLFNSEKFMEKYMSMDIKNITVHCNYHQYEIVFYVRLNDNTIELTFDQNNMIDYSTIEATLHLMP